MKIQVVEHDYMNTGGGCMVSVFYVVLHDEKESLYVIVNEEGGTISTTDFIRHDIAFADWMVVESVQFENLTIDNKYFELYQMCAFKYFEKDCRRYSSNSHLPLHLFPKKMVDALPAGYIKWHQATVGSTFETNGYEIILDQSWQDDNSPIGAASEIIEYMSTEFDAWTKSDRDEAFYNKMFTIGFGDVAHKFNNNAGTYQAVLKCLKTIIDEC